MQSVLNVSDGESAMDSRPNSVFTSLAALLALLLAACQSQEPQNDPIRDEFVEACIGRIEYRSMPPDKRTAYCKCGYDNSLHGLSDKEKQFARFYLLEQVGVNVQSRGLITEPDMDAMVKASNAIGNAVKRCN